MKTHCRLILILGLIFLSMSLVGCIEEIMQNAVNNNTTGSFLVPNVNVATTYPIPEESYMIYMEYASQKMPVDGVGTAKMFMELWGYATDETPDGLTAIQFVWIHPYVVITYNDNNGSKTIEFVESQNGLRGRPIYSSELNVRPPTTMMGYPKTDNERKTLLTKYKVDLNQECKDNLLMSGYPLADAWFSASYLYPYVYMEQSTSLIYAPLHEIDFTCEYVNGVDGAIIGVNQMYKLFEPANENFYRAEFLGEKNNKYSSLDNYFNNYAVDIASLLFTISVTTKDGKPLLTYNYNVKGRLEFFLTHDFLNKVKEASPSEDKSWLYGQTPIWIDLTEQVNSDPAIIHRDMMDDEVTFLCRVDGDYQTNCDSQTAGIISNLSTSN